MKSQGSALVPTGRYSMQRNKRDRTSLRLHRPTQEQEVQVKPQEAKVAGSPTPQSQLIVTTATALTTTRGWRTADLCSSDYSTIRRFTTFRICSLAD